MQKAAQEQKLCQRCTAFLSSASKKIGSSFCAPCERAMREENENELVRQPIRSEKEVSRRLCVSCKTQLEWHAKTDRCGSCHKTFSTQKKAKKQYRKQNFRILINPGKPSNDPELTPQVIVRVVSAAYGINPEQMVGRSHGGNVISWARHLATYLVHKDMGMHFGQVGLELGLQKIVVSYGYNAVEQRIQKDPAVRKTIQEIRSRYIHLREFNG